MKRKSNSFLYLGGSVLLILAAIVATAVVNRFRVSNNTTDIRTKAGTTATLQLVATVSSIDENKGVIVVDNLQFANSQGSNPLGSWAVTPPTGFNFGSVGPGTRVTITIDPTSMIVNTRTVTATQITVSR